MARVVVLGAGISGHTAALHLRRCSASRTRSSWSHRTANYNWIPSNIWVGVGRMTPSRSSSRWRRSTGRRGSTSARPRPWRCGPRARTTAPAARSRSNTPSPARSVERERVEYDYLINATGPKLNFARDPGPRPGRRSLAVGLHRGPRRAGRRPVRARSSPSSSSGERQRLVIGVGHGTCTCEGAAFEYAFNVEHELRSRGLRDLAEVVYLTNEYELGDFGVGGMTFKQNGFVTTSQLWTESLFEERGVTRDPRRPRATGRGRQAVLRDPRRRRGRARLRLRDAAAAVPRPGPQGLRPRRRRHQHRGVRPERLPQGRRRLHPEDLRRVAGRRTGPAPTPARSYPNVFGVGIAFAPPHPISRPRTAPNGTVISPAPPRTGMPSGPHGPRGRPQHRRHDPERRDRADPHGVDGRDGRCAASPPPAPGSCTAPPRR